MEAQTHDIGPWYKQRWLWFILAPIIAVMIYASIFMYFAITTSDGIVRDDYYKVARGMNVDTSKQDRAIAMGIEGSLLLDSLTGDVRVVLSATEALPEILTLDLVHPTHQKYDQTISVKKVDPNTNIFLGSLQQRLEGRRYLLLSDEATSWRIRSEINPPYEQNKFALSAASQ